CAARRRAGCRAGRAWRRSAPCGAACAAWSWVYLSGSVTCGECGAVSLCVGAAPVVADGRRDEHAPCVRLGGVGVAGERERLALGPRLGHAVVEHVRDSALIGRG